jgi:4-hydroxybenzoate polyprenyltransferase
MGNRMKDYIAILRPSHWVKNVFVFVGLVFGGKLIGPADEVLLALGRAVVGFLCFCLAASAIYIFNDIIDRPYDRVHPTKRNRPIASGKVAVGSAAGVSILCVGTGIIGSILLGEWFAAVIAAYILLMALYSVLLKRLMIWDCIVIAAGFCLRAVGGAVVVAVPISPWLIVCTFALCLFLGFGKRRSEIAQMGIEGSDFRQTLEGYTPELLAHILDVTSGLAIICFVLYAMDERTVRVFGSNHLVYTTAFVLYCVFRFSMLIQQGRFSDPVELILRDLPFQIGFCLWVLSCLVIIYAGKAGIRAGWCLGQ